MLSLALESTSTPLEQEEQQLALGLLALPLCFENLWV
jgi:hypothetical protein